MRLITSLLNSVNHTRLHQAHNQRTGSDKTAATQKRELRNIQKGGIGVRRGKNRGIGVCRVRLEELVGDRKRWKDITAASMAVRAFRMTT